MFGGGKRWANWGRLPAANLPPRQARPSRRGRVTDSVATGTTRNECACAPSVSREPGFV